GDRTAQFAIAQNGYRPIWIRTGMVCELREQVVDRFRDRPIVRRIVAKANETLGFTRVMRCVEQLTRAKQEHEMRAHEGRVANLRCFGQRMSLEGPADPPGQ